MKKDLTLPGCRLSQGKAGLLHLDGLYGSLPKDHQEFAHLFHVFKKAIQLVRIFYIDFLKVKKRK